MLIENPTVDGIVARGPGEGAEKEELPEASA